ncbi:hypothetical protein J5893_03130 [bacterium]|nr:hypothetical protein [bacterium]
MREIASRTKKIPAEGQGNIDWMLASGNRLDFNRLDYADAENFTFMLDKGDRAPYISGTIEKNLVYSFT